MARRHSAGIPSAKPRLVAVLVSLKLHCTPRQASLKHPCCHHVSPCWKPIAVLTLQESSPEILKTLQQNHKSLWPRRLKVTCSPTHPLARHSQQMITWAQPLETVHSLELRDGISATPGTSKGLGEEEGLGEEGVLPRHKLWLCPCHSLCWHIPSSHLTPTEGVPRFRWNSKGHSSSPRQRRKPAFPWRDGSCFGKRLLRCTRRQVCSRLPRETGCSVAASHLP